MSPRERERAYCVLCLWRKIYHKTTIFNRQVESIFSRQVDKSLEIVLYSVLIIFLIQ